jgi:hypothetical protein
MTLDELKQLVQEAQWFSKLGSFPGGEGQRVIRDLAEPEEPDDWDWLPTTQTQTDPIHVVPLKQVAAAQGKAQDLHRHQMEVYRLALTSLRQVPDNHPPLCIGASNLAPAAKGAALFAIRMAVAEIITGAQGFWCALIPLYVGGYWPCGLDDEQRVVVL